MMASASVPGSSTSIRAWPAGTGTRSTEPKNSRTAAGIPISASTFSPRRAVSRRLHPDLGERGLRPRAPVGSCRAADEVEVGVLERPADRAELDDEPALALRPSAATAAMAAGARRQARPGGSGRRRASMSWPPVAAPRAASSASVERPVEPDPEPRPEAGRQLRGRARGDDPTGDEDVRSDRPAARRRRGRGWSAGRRRPRRAGPRRSARVAARPSGSMPAVGSSRMTTSGRPTSARASPSRWRSPPDSRRYRVVGDARSARRGRASSSGSRGSAWNRAYWCEGLARSRAHVDAAALEHQARRGPAAPARRGPGPRRGRGRARHRRRDSPRRSRRSWSCRRRSARAGRRSRPAATVERHAVDDGPVAVSLDQAIDLDGGAHGAIFAYWRSKSASVSSPIWIDRMTPSASTK